MPPLSTVIIDKYFANADDIEISSEAVPNTSSMNNVSYFIDGHNYFAAIRTEMSRLLAGGSNRFFYFTDWWLGLVESDAASDFKNGSAWGSIELAPQPAFVLDDGSGVAHPEFIDELENLSRQGIDVRAFVWVSPQILNLNLDLVALTTAGLWGLNVQSLKSVAELRSRINMQNKVVLNTLAHPFGSMHLKMVVCGDDTQMCAFTGGIDLAPGRASNRTHSTPLHKWHDAAARVEGPATNGIYNYFRQLWNEQLSRRPLLFRISDGVSNQHVPTHVISLAANFPPGVPLPLSYPPGTYSNQVAEIMPLVPQRAAPALVSPGRHHVQVLRTLPNIGASAPKPIGIPPVFNTPRISFAPDGLFEFRLAMKKAISNANDYIYIEDQAFTSLETMDWINQRLLAVPSLKVILLWGADPSDPPNASIFKAINDSLLTGVSNPNNRVVFYKRGDNITIHSKITIIDDLWMAIGSANCMRRSLYTDGEISVSLLDDASQAFAVTGSPPPEIPLPRRLRVDLTLEHCTTGPEIIGSNHPLLEMTAGLAVWNPSWGVPLAAYTLKPELERMSLPFEVVPYGPGTVDLTDGVSAVTGHGTTWLPSDTGRYFKAVGHTDDGVYRIAFVDNPEGMRLDRPYEIPKKDPIGLTGRSYQLHTSGKWLADKIPVFDKDTYDLIDFDSR